MLSRDAVDPERQRLVRPAPADCPTSLLLPSPSFSFLLLPGAVSSLLFPAAAAFFFSSPQPCPSPLAAAGGSVTAIVPPAFSPGLPDYLWQVPAAG